MASNSDKLASILYVTIQRDKCKGDMELVNISSNYIALLECKRCKTKKYWRSRWKGVEKELWHTGGYSGCNEKFACWFKKVFI